MLHTPNIILQRVNGQQTTNKHENRTIRRKFCDLFADVIKQAGHACCVMIGFTGLRLYYCCACTQDTRQRCMVRFSKRRHRDVNVKA